MEIKKNKPSSRDEFASDMSRGDNPDAKSPTTRHATGSYDPFTTKMSSFDDMLWPARRRSGRHLR